MYDVGENLVDSKRADGHADWIVKTEVSVFVFTPGATDPWFYACMPAVGNGASFLYNDLVADVTAQNVELQISPCGVPISAELCGLKNTPSTYVLWELYSCNPPETAREGVLAS